MTDLPEDNPDVIAASSAPHGDISHDAPVLIFQAATNEEVEVVRATLEASGITAILKTQTVHPYMGAIDATVGSMWQHGIYVSPSDAEAARAILNAPAPTEEELTAEEEADPTTLAEAEARANRT